LESISRGIDMRILVLPGDGIGPEIADAGRDRANPASRLLSSAMPIECLAQPHGRGALAGAGQGVRAAVDRLSAEPGGWTSDPGGALVTRAFGQAVVAALA
jgi:3-isopropylmalate dehydrogenase